VDNKKYIDKILEHLVRGTKIDYEKETISFPFSHTNTNPILSLSKFLTDRHLLSWLFSPHSPDSSFSYHCRDHFGLTKEEIKYVWKEYKSIITDKIKDGK
jgi:hypothetical protein